MRQPTALLAAFAVAAAVPAFAQKSSSDHSAHHAEVQAQAAALSEGEVRKVDKNAKKITIKHGPLTNLDMPAMTMVFQVKDSKMLEQVKTGDKIRFIAERVGGQYTVTKVEAVK